MVKRAPGLLPATLALLVLAQLAAPGAREYQLGNVLEQDIIAPDSLIVIDEEETAVLKQRAAQRVAIHFRHYPNTSREIEEAFRASFAATRSNFVDAMEVSFNRRKLNPQGLAMPKFQRLVASFQKQNKLFPVSTNLARIWASGESDRAIEESLAARVHAAAEQPIRPDGLPADIKLGNTVRLVPLMHTNEFPTLFLAERRGSLVPRTNMLMLARARTELQNSFPPGERAIGRFLSSFLRPNCVIDLDLTGQVRARRTESVWAADRYEAGQIIARRGQVVDRKVKAALSALGEKIALGELEQRAIEEELRVAKLQARQRWLVAGGGCAFLFAGAVGWRIARRRPNMSLLPARRGDVPGTAVISCPSCEEEIIVAPAALEEAAAMNDSQSNWQRRALVAEQQARNAQAVARTGLLAHLARLMKTRVVQRLTWQRGDLLDAQEKAAAEMAEMEERLRKIHAPLQDRLRAYEKRIAELDKELSARGEENRELIKAKILMARKQLEAERARTDWN
jgi:hypothetical protein